MVSLQPLTQFLILVDIKINLWLEIHEDLSIKEWVNSSVNKLVGPSLA